VASHLYRVGSVYTIYNSIENGPLYEIAKSPSDLYIYRLKKIQEKRGELHCGSCNKKEHWCIYYKCQILILEYSFMNIRAYLTNVKF